MAITSSRQSPRCGCIRRNGLTGECHACFLFISGSTMGVRYCKTQTTQRCPLCASRLSAKPTGESIKRRKDFIFGPANRVKVNGPCKTISEGLDWEGVQYGPQYAKIDTNVQLEELFEIMNILIRSCTISLDCNSTGSKLIPNRLRTL